MVVRHPRRTLALVAAVAAATVCSGGGPELTEGGDGDSPDPRPLVIGYYRDLVFNADRSATPTSVAEVMAGADLVVVGSIADVGRGRAVDQGEEQVEVDWDDEAVDFRSIHFDVVVDEVIGDGSGVAVGDRVPVGLTVGTDIDPGLVADGLRELGERVLVFLVDSAVFAYDPGRRGVALDGGLLATVGPGEIVNLSFFPPEYGPTLTSSMPTLAEVRAAA